MSEVATEPQAPPTEAPETGLPPVTDAMREAFRNPQPATQPEPQAPASTATPGEPAPQAEPAAPAPKDYSDLLKVLGVPDVDTLKTKWAASKDYDPAAYEAAKANQRDDHDKVVRDMLADPAKAQAYFALQNLKPEEMAKGSPDDQRALLFEKYKLDNPHFTGRLAEIEFEEEFENKYALAENGAEDDPATERAKLRLEAALGLAAPAVKAAQEAAKVAVLPKSAEAQGPTPEDTAAWLSAVEGALKQPLDYTVQVDGQPVKVAINAADPGLKSFLHAPEDALLEALDKAAYPEGRGPGKQPNMAGLAQFYARLTHPDASAKAVADHARAAIGAHVPLSGLANPAPDAPQPVTGPGDDSKPSPGALAQMRAIAQGRN